MTIPVSALIAMAKPFKGQVSSFSFPTCDRPPEGAKCAPLNISFQESAVIRVDLSALASSSPALSQIAALYVDNSIILAFDVYITILFEGGFQYTVTPGNSAMIPVLSNKYPPAFYVAATDTNGDPISGTISANIFALNQYIPSFASNTLISTLAKQRDGQNPLAPYPLPTILRARIFDYTELPNDDFFGNINYIGIDVVGNATLDGSQYVLNVRLRQSNQNVFNLPFILNTAIAKQSILHFEQLNIISDNDIVYSLDTIVNIAALTLYINLG